MCLGNCHTLSVHVDSIPPYSLQWRVSLHGSHKPGSHYEPTSEMIVQPVLLPSNQITLPGAFYLLSIIRPAVFVDSSILITTLPTSTPLEFLLTHGLCFRETDLYMKRLIRLIPKHIPHSLLTCSVFQTKPIVPSHFMPSTS